MSQEFVSLWYEGDCVLSMQDERDKEERRGGDGQVCVDTHFATS